MKLKKILKKAAKVLKKVALPVAVVAVGGVAGAAVLKKVQQVQAAAKKAKAAAKAAGIFKTNKQNTGGDIAPAAVVQEQTAAAEVRAPAENWFTRLLNAIFGKPQTQT